MSPDDGDPERHLDGQRDLPPRDDRQEYARGNEPSVDRSSRKHPGSSRPSWWMRRCHPSPKQGPGTTGILESGPDCL
jgi:hypothetical protein